ncbi:MAG: PIN-like domain-containing protein [Chloroflexota bacterium]
MRKTFPGYYRPTEHEFHEMWKECLFVLDANVLLNLYRYSPATSEELISILTQISDRLWVPYQAALEYHQRRLDVVAQQAEAYGKIQDLLLKTQKKLEDQLRSFLKHPFIEVDRLLEKVRATFNEIEGELDERKQEHPDLPDGDDLRDTITALLEGKVGSPYSQKQLDEIYKRGKTRYERKIPPGYSDVKHKEGERVYGDLVLWLQVMDEAKETKKPVILVTDDGKEDWWLKFSGRTIGPRPELTHEMLSRAGVPFYMYQADQFMEHGRKYLERQVNQEAIDEVRDVRQRDEESIKAIQAAAYRISDEALRALRQAAALRFPYEEIQRTLRQAAALRFPDEEIQRTLRQAAGFHIPDESTEDTMENDDVLDSGSEGEPDESDGQADTGGE